MKRLKTLFLIFIAGFLSVSPVFAIDRETLRFFSDAGIFWYDNSELLAGCIPDKTPQGSSITWLGDRNMIGYKAEIEAKFPGIDLSQRSYDNKTISFVDTERTFASGIKDVETLVKEGDIKPILVYAVGIDDPINIMDIRPLMEAVGESHNVILTTRNRNSSFGNASMNYPNVAIVYWDDTKSKAEMVDAFYDAAMTLTSARASLTTQNINYAGVQVWSDEEIQMIQANQPTYQKIATKYNIPWQTIAVIHSIEHSLLRTNPDNGQGIYQLYSYTEGGTNENRFEPTSTAVSVSEFERQTELAASIIAGYNLDLSTDAGVKKMFFKYNGASEVYVNKARSMGFTAEEAANGEGSPYVMNRFDARRDPTSPQMNPVWAGRYTGDNSYSANSTSEKFGAFVKYQALGGSSGFCAAYSRNITEVALKLSWPGNRTHAKDDPKPEYITAMKDVGNYIDPCNGSGCAPKGASCDIFVSTVMRFSGADPDYPQYGPERMREYMLAHPDKYQEIEHNGDFGTLQSGDIFVTNGHILLYVEIDGNPGQASASFNERTGEHYNAIYFEDTLNSTTRYYRVFRRIY